MDLNKQLKPRGQKRTDLSEICTCPVSDMSVSHTESMQAQFWSPNFMSCNERNTLSRGSKLFCKAVLLELGLSPWTVELHQNQPDLLKAFG